MMFLKGLRAHLDTAEQQKKINDFKLDMTTQCAEAWKMFPDLEELQNLVCTSAKMEWGEETKVDFDFKNKAVCVQNKNGISSVI